MKTKLMIALLLLLGLSACQTEVETFDQDAQTAQALQLLPANINAVSMANFDHIRNQEMVADMLENGIPGTPTEGNMEQLHARLAEMGLSVDMVHRAYFSAGVNEKSPEGRFVIYADFSPSDFEDATAKVNEDLPLIRMDFEGGVAFKLDPDVYVENYMANMHEIMTPEKVADYIAEMEEDFIEIAEEMYDQENDLLEARVAEIRKEMAEMRTDLQNQMTPERLAEMRADMQERMHHAGNKMHFRLSQGGVVFFTDGPIVLVPDHELTDDFLATFGKKNIKRDYISGVLSRISPDEDAWVVVAKGDVELPFDEMGDMDGNEIAKSMAKLMQMTDNASVSVHLDGESFVSTTYLGVGENMSADDAKSMTKGVISAMRIQNKDNADLIAALDQIDISVPNDELMRIDIAIDREFIETLHNED